MCFTSRNAMLVLLITMTVTVILTSCSSGKPIVTGAVNSMTVTCMDSETSILVNDKKTLEELVEKINTGSRQETHEIELAEGHKAILETSSNTYDMTLYNTGKVVVDGFYVDADVQNFCTE